MATKLKRGERVNQRPKARTRQTGGRNTSGGSRYGQSLQKRTTESHKRQNNSGRFGTIWKDSDLPIMKIKEGQHCVDIVPYICGENNPYTPAGEADYMLDIFVHYGVGPMENAYVCMARTYGGSHRCPVCELQQQMKRSEEFSDDDVKALDAKRRCYYNVIEYAEDGTPKDMQIMDMAHWNMERHLQTISDDPRGGGQIVFSDPVEGKQVCFTRTGTGARNTSYTGHRFLDRDYNLGDEIVDEAFCLDDLITLPDYDEVKDVCDAMQNMGGGEDDGEDDDIPVDPQGSPQSTRSRRTRPSSNAETCPAGGEFGFDNGQLTECETCDLWDACAEKADMSENEDPPEPPVKKRLNRSRR